MSDQINGIGVRVDAEVGRRLGAAVSNTRRVAAAEGSFQHAGTLPPTAQWQCPVCGQPNLGRADVCGRTDCGESRPASPVHQHAPSAGGEQ